MRLTQAERFDLLAQIACHRRSYIRRMAKAEIAESQGRDSGFFIDRADNDFMTAVRKLDMLYRDRE